MQLLDILGVGVSRRSHERKHDFSTVRENKTNQAQESNHRRATSNDLSSMGGASGEGNALKGNSINCERKRPSFDIEQLQERNPLVGG